MSDAMPPDPLASVTTLVSAAGGGAVLLKVVERMFARHDKRDDDAVSIRRELREQVSALQKRQDELETRLDTERDTNARLFAENESLKAENHRIRAENHELRGFLTTLVVHAQMLHRKCGLPEADLPRIPEWLTRSTPGPTTGAQAEGAS